MCSNCPSCCHKQSIITLLSNYSKITKLLFIGVDCGSISSPSNGQVIVTSTTFGSTARYSCDSGYDLVGASSRTCQSSGQWSGAAPTCTAVSLPPAVSTTTSPPEGQPVSQYLCACNIIRSVAGCQLWGII